MKKLIISALCAIMVVTSFATSYQVYGLKMNIKTTTAKGYISDCDDCGDYCYRDKANVVIRGLIGGCGCEAILANGACANAIVYMWDETRKLPITNVTTTTGWRVQRIGKKQTVVEHFFDMTATYGEYDQYSFNVCLAGFGTYKIKSDPNDSYVGSISGNVSGYAAAPIYTKAGVCTTCSYEPDEYYVTTAVALCTACGDAQDPLLTPFYGSYSVKYDSTCTKKVNKYGFTSKGFGLPSYVGLEDYVATNIGE